MYEEEADIDKLKAAIAGAFLQFIVTINVFYWSFMAIMYGWIP